MRITEWLMILGGVAAGLFGFLILVGGMLGLPEAENQLTHTAGIAAFGLIPLAGGGVLIRRALGSASRRRREGLERSILELAGASEGRLSPAAVARATPLTLDEAKATLDSLHLSGHCRTELHDDGSLEYLFD